MGWTIDPRGLTSCLEFIRIYSPPLHDHSQANNADPWATVPGRAHCKLNPLLLITINTPLQFQPQPQPGAILITSPHCTAPPLTEGSMEELYQVATDNNITTLRDVIAKSNHTVLSLRWDALIYGGNCK